MIPHPIHTPGVDNDIHDAITFLLTGMSSKVHRDGQPASLHSLRVGLSQHTKRRMILGFLHDLVEDCGDKWYDAILIRFGKDIADSVLLLSHRDGSYMEYIASLVSDMDCVHVKIADLRDNMEPNRTDARAREKAPVYGQAYDFLMEHLRKNNIL